MRSRLSRIDRHSTSATCSAIPYPPAPTRTPTPERPVWANARAKAAPTESVLERIHRIHPIAAIAAVRQQVPQVVGRLLIGGIVRVIRVLFGDHLWSRQAPTGSTTGSAAIGTG